MIAAGLVCKCKANLPLKSHPVCRILGIPRFFSPVQSAEHLEVERRRDEISCSSIYSNIPTLNKHNFVLIVREK